MRAQSLPPDTRPWMSADSCPHCRAGGEFFPEPLSDVFAVFSGCGGELSGPSGSFHSPGYPSSYPRDRECIWYIHTAPGSSIQLTIQDFDIRYHPNCSYDVLEVRASDLLLKDTQFHAFLSGADHPKNCQRGATNSTAVSHSCCGYSYVPQVLSQKPQCSCFSQLLGLLCLHTWLSNDAGTAVANKRQNCPKKQP